MSANKPRQSIIPKSASPQRAHFIALGLTLTLGLTWVEALLNPAPAAACFFWQACARRRGQASNTLTGGKRTGRIRGGNNPAIPYVISPRNSWIGAPPATIRWNSVEGAHRYRISLWQWAYERDLPNFALWETTVEDGNEVAFPALTLEPGIYYSFEVIAEMADGEVSSNQDEGYYSSGFQLLFAEDYAVLRSRLAQVNAGNEANTEAATLARAGVYFLDDMYADALQILAQWAQTHTASDLVYTALGDTYSKIGLNLLAIEAYGQALNLATANNDILSEATILVNLADVYATLGEFDQAKQRLNRARIAYSLLGAQTEILGLDRRLAVLSNVQ